MSDPKETEETPPPETETPQPPQEEPPAEPEAIVAITGTMIVQEIEDTL